MHENALGFDGSLNLTGDGAQEFLIVFAEWGRLGTVDDIPADILKSNDSKLAGPPLYGALLKNEQDVHLFEQLVFLHRRQQGR